jgi:hypothetical protein
VNKTTDGGITWPQMNTGLLNQIVEGFAIDPNATATVYVGTGLGVFKTTNGAATWAASSSGLPTPNVWALAIDPTATATIYAGTAAGLFKSSNGGASWTAASTGLPAGTVFALAIDPSSPRTLYAGTASGVWRSDDGAGSWSAANAGISSTAVVSFALDRPNATLYAGDERRLRVIQRRRGTGRPSTPACRASRSTRSSSTPAEFSTPRQRRRLPFVPAAPARLRPSPRRESIRVERLDPLDNWELGRLLASRRRREILAGRWA